MKKRKNPLTLLEIMIVIFLIGLIGSVIGYNMKGSLDEGKAFKTKQAAAQIQDILLLELASGTSLDKVIANPEKYLKKSGLVKDPKKMLLDGWGKPFEITATKGENIKIHSSSLTTYNNKKKKDLKDIEPDESSVSLDEEE